MVENYLEPKEIQKLEDTLPYYKENRIKGINAGHIADILGIPLKDVISFLIERKELNGKQVDLELIRVMISKNPELKESIIQKSNLTFDEIDVALATDDSLAIRKMGCESEYQKTFAYSLIPQVMIFGGLVNLSQGIVFSICLTIAGMIFMQLFNKYSSKSDIEIMTKILEGC